MAYADEIGPDDIQVTTYLVPNQYDWLKKHADGCGAEPGEYLNFMVSYCMENVLIWNPEVMEEIRKQEAVG